MTVLLWLLPLMFSIETILCRTQNACAFVVSCLTLSVVIVGRCEIARLAYA